jgi:hypothetical protein
MPLRTPDCQEAICQDIAPQSINLVGPAGAGCQALAGWAAMTHVWITITGREVTERRRNAVVTVRSGPNAIARTIAKGGITNGFSVRYQWRLFSQDFRNSKSAASPPDAVVQLDACPKPMGSGVT